MPHGTGHYRHNNGDEFLGTWDEGQRLGLGEYRWAPANPNTSKFRDLHYGQFARLPHGRGVRIHHYGDKFRGEFRVGERSGHGTTNCSDALGAPDAGNWHSGFYAGGRASGSGYEVSAAASARVCSVREAIRIVSGLGGVAGRSFVVRK